MGIKKALVVGSDGLPQQLQSGDSLSVPTSGGEAVQLINGNAGSIVKGASVYISSAGTVDKARANAASTCKAIGLVGDTSIAAAGTGTIQTDGVMTATTTEWDAVAGTTGGLTAGAMYFVDPTTAGKITSIVPTTVGQLVQKMGRAISSTDFLIDTSDPILL